MAIHQMVNFNKPGTPIVSSGDVLIECNLFKYVMTLRFPGIEELTIIGGTCINSIFPADTIFGGATPEIATPNIAMNDYGMVEGKMRVIKNNGKMLLKDEQKITKQGRKELFKRIHSDITHKKILHWYKKEIKEAKEDKEVKNG